MVGCQLGERENREGERERCQWAITRRVIGFSLSLSSFCVRWLGSDNRIDARREEDSLGQNGLLWWIIYGSLDTPRCVLGVGWAFEDPGGDMECVCP